ncbi:hypothetical protein K438DRAFT_1672267 [Mycena galopus ATCC 62051]|nr:hypothetical protein K438DRAFT_1672267 [Mycena galopus ATCC 62051]
MQFIFAVLLAAVTSVTAQCPLCPATIPLFRSDNFQEVDHFYTANATEAVNAAVHGWALEGVAAGIFPTQITGSSPLFRLYNSALTDHAYTTSTTEVDALEAAGYILEATPGFVYTNQTCYSVPLYGLYHAGATDHFYTTSVSERSSAMADRYTDLGITAYVPSPGIIVYGNSC